MRCASRFSQLVVISVFSVTAAASYEGPTAPKGVSGVSGHRFSGNVIREVSKSDLCFSGMKRSDLKVMRDSAQCERWIVVTSIFQPSPATRMLGRMTRDGWCFVVVADKNGPPEYDDVEGVVYLTVERQRALHYQILDFVPWRHFGRKNIGYLYAIAHGAKVIYDTDDDNRLKEAIIPILGADEQSILPRNWPVNVTRPDEDFVAGAGVLFNPYASFQSTCGDIWPRGFPLDYIRSHGKKNWSLSSAQLEKPPAIQQYLADEDPDVDAVFRLTRSLPCFFHGLPAGSPPVLAVPPNHFVPYNAQATVHLYDAFWGLLLPVTVHGRVSDIWRAYLTQKLLWDVGQVVSFTSPHVVHDRVAHDYLKDFQSEQDLYLKSTSLAGFLMQWTSDAPTLIERIEQLWAELYMRGFVELEDLKLAQAWLRDLLAVGYKFPELQLGKIMWVSSSSEQLATAGLSTASAPV